MEIIPRPRLFERIQRAVADYPVVALIGARQVGKTTMAKRFANHFFDLERSLDAYSLNENAMGILGSLSGIVVVDEAQQMPELFAVLRVLADRQPTPARFIITGSVSPRLLSAAAESLAGRVAWIEVGGFTLEEVGPENWRQLWLRGGMPRSYLAANDFASIDVRENYLDSLIGRDLRFWGMDGYDPAYIRRLLMLVADTSSHSWNHSGAASNLQVSYKTVQKHVSILGGAFLLREMMPFTVTMEGRLRKSSKLVMRDSGVMHALLRIAEHVRLDAHMRMGGSWETFCIQQIMAMTETRQEDAWAWNVHGGAEVDLLLDRTEGRYGFEMKHADVPSTTRSMHTGISDLQLKKLFVVHPGDQRFSLHPQAPIEAVGIERLVEVCRELRRPD